MVPSFRETTRSKWSKSLLSKTNKNNKKLLLRGWDLESRNSCSTLLSVHANCVDAQGFHAVCMHVFASANQCNSRATACVFASANQCNSRATARVFASANQCNSRATADLMRVNNNKMLRLVGMCTVSESKISIVRIY